MAGGTAHERVDWHDGNSLGRGLGLRIGRSTAAAGSAATQAAFAAVQGAIGAAEHEGSAGGYGGEDEDGLDD